MTVAAIAAAVTSSPAMPFANSVVSDTGEEVFYGLTPEINLELEDLPAGSSIVYATRWNSEIYSAEGDPDEFAGPDGKLELALLMSAARPANDRLAPALMGRVSPGFNSIIAVRDKRGRKDLILTFNQVRAIGAGDVQIDEVASLGHKALHYVSAVHPPRSTIIFLGGTSGSVHHQALALWAAAGIQVFSLPWVQGATKTGGCLDRVDVNLIHDEVSRIYRSAIHLGPVSLVGHSGGADAALMIANKATLDLHSVHAIAPTAWHFNGSRGPGCSLPASPWTLEGATVPYILNFPLRWDTPWTTLSRAAGGLSQNTLAVRALELAGPAKREEVLFDVSNITASTHLYAGGLDDLTPSGASVLSLCGRLPAAECYVEPEAGHDIFGAPSQTVFCESPREALRGVPRARYCRATASARQHVFRSVRLAATQPD